jgi:hypothetical protein
MQTGHGILLVVLYIPLSRWLLLVVERVDMRLVAVLVAIALLLLENLQVVGHPQRLF